MMNAPLELVRAFGETQHEVLALDVPAIADHLQDLPSNVRYIPFEMKRKLDPAIFQLRDLIRKERPDVIHPYLSQTLAAAVLATLRLPNAPKIVAWRGITRVPSRWDPANHISFLSRRIAYYSCESNAVKESMLRAGVPERNCETVYNCVRPANLLRESRDVLERYSIPRDAFVVGTVASIRPVKGIDLLLEAAIACRDLENVHFLIVGPVKDGRVKKLAKDSRLEGRLHIAGVVPGASSLMSVMDLFVMPSRQEGLCRALLEAMGQGVCPVVSDAGGMKEVVRHGIDGYVFPKENVPALTAAIRSLHANPRLIAQYGSSALQRMLDMCTPELMRERMMGIYDRCDPRFDVTGVKMVTRSVSEG